MAGNESEARKMPETKTGKAAPGGQYLSGGTTAMLIRIFGRKAHEPYGDIVHHDLKKPVPYQSAAELVLKIDAISRSLAIPDSGSAFRSVQKPRDEGTNMLPEEYWKKDPAGKESQEAGSPLPGAPVILCYPRQDTDTGASPPPKVHDTIYLQLIGRQHTSIQGRIWGRITRKRYVSFRSALELIYLLSEAV